MIDFAAARRMMVNSQVRTGDVTDQRIPAGHARSSLVSASCPPDNAALAYLDFDVPVSLPRRVGRRLLKPMVLAKMVQAAEVRPADHVLDVGCATGYSSALLARLAAAVVALEEDPALAKLADANLREFAPGRATLVTGPLPEVGPKRAPSTSFFSMA